MKEHELANIIIDHYKNDGYKVYKEVTAKGSTGGGTARADIILQKDNLHIGIETKISFGLKVIQQAFTWKSKTNYTYLCIPKTKMTSMKRFGYDICRDYGIGIIEVDKNMHITIKQESSFNSTPDLPKLYEEQTMGEAGITGKHFTPFKLTVNKVVDYVQVNGECVLDDVIANIKHHYKNDKSAKQSLLKLIKIGVIKLNLLKLKGKYIISVT